MNERKICPLCEFPINPDKDDVQWCICDFYEKQIIGGQDEETENI